MPRFRHIPQIQQLMSKKDCIRNIGIIAHIDHGKTTLADALLAGAGLLSSQMAGTARVLDYLAEEQKRKITIKTANITLLYSHGGEQYIINLVDTPGHVDFTGKVTRALRIIDGAVVLVDAVEEIMAQTEILTRQALQERVQPVLFINKIDRLITELQLSEEQIQKKLNHIIGTFNDLIDLYAEAPFKSQWKISPKQGNIALGAALHGWGFTLNGAKQKGIKFSNIIAAYKNLDWTKLKQTMPVQEAIIEMAIKSVPNPREAQSYRIGGIWEGNPNSKAGQALIHCSDEGPTAVFVTNAYTDDNGDTTASGRIFSGKVKKSDKLQLIRAAIRAEVEAKAVYVDMGALREEVPEASAGSLVTLTLDGKVAAGETLGGSMQEEEGLVPFEGISYVSEPVVTVAIEPKNPKDIDALQKSLGKLATEDPNLKAFVNEITGEYLLSGMGELHLEVTLNQLKNNGLEVVVSSPRVVYMESVTKAGAAALARSPNKQNSFRIKVEPQQQNAEKNRGVLVTADEHQNCLLDVSSKTQQLSPEVLQAIISGFKYAAQAGPLCGEPMRQVQVDLVDMELSADATGDSEVMRGVGKAIFGSYLTANPALLEPIYKIIITVASELSSESSRILQTSRGQVTGFEQKGLLTQITGFIPVAETFGFSKELRSATSGRAFWQSFFSHWEKVPQKQASEVIAELRRRKGLAPEVPSPEKFMEQ
jgi:elongation factor 2